MKKNPLSFVKRTLAYGTRLDITIIAIAVILVVAVIAFFLYRTREDHLSVTVSQEIDDTPTLLTEIREIGQWEFLTISDEEMVDTIRRGFFSDDELTRIYYGTVRIGIDFSKADENWINHEGKGIAIAGKGDSIYVNLPQCTLLDDDFLDETRTKSFIEKGTWTNADRKALAERARQAILQRCLTWKNLSQAQQNAEQQVSLFIQKVMAARR